MAGFNFPHKALLWFDLRKLNNESFVIRGKFSLSEVSSAQQSKRGTGHDLQCFLPIDLRHSKRQIRYLGEQPVYIWGPSLSVGLDMGRTSGYPVRALRDRPNQLEDYTCTGLPVPDDPENPKATYRAAGIERPEENRRRYFEISQAIHNDPVSNDVKEVARVFSFTCPGDWDVSWGPGLSTKFQQEIHGHDPNDRCYGEINVVDFVTY